MTPVSDYYILAGVIYQAPDIGADSALQSVLNVIINSFVSGAVLNSRILTGVSHLQAAFEEARGYSRYVVSTEGEVNLNCQVPSQ